jgi:pimeloyl-ACP methyl ester carboxylesterase
MHVVLVHGSYHGAWCWERLTPHLVAAGHRVTAVDLPIGDAAAGASAYADAAIAQADWDEPPVIVGHSMAGLVTPLMAARRPVRRLVFLAAMLAKPGSSAGEQRAAEPIDAPVDLANPEWTDLGDDVWMVGPNTATALFFHDATPEDAAWAAGQLRPQAYRVMNEATPLAAWPDVPSTYVVCRDDHAVNAAWGRATARDRLGVMPLEIDGGHSPFITRPAELAALLDPVLR